MSELAANVNASRSNAAGRRFAGFLLSFFVVGAGHVLLGRWRRGLVLLAGVLLLLLSIPATGNIGTFGGVALYLAIPFDVLLIRPGPRPTWGRLFAIWIGLFAFLQLFRFSIQTYYLEAFSIRASGMAPTLVPGDHIFVSKLRRNPDRGGVIVFRYPQLPEQRYVARVIGVEGDRIEVRNGMLLVNGNEAKETDPEPCEYLARGEVGTQWMTQTALCSEQTLGAARFVVAHRPDLPSHDFPENGAEPFVVPESSVFVMGDNRKNSADSRYWGTVPIGNVEGTALFVWWSFSGDDIRWNRMGEAIR